MFRRRAGSWRGVVGPQLVGPQHSRKHDLHLQHRERRAEASPPPAAERDPRVGPRGRIEEALRPERVGVRVDVGVVMEQVGVGHETASGGVGPAADLVGLGDEARRGVRQHRAAAKRLLDRRSQVGLAVALVDLLQQAPERGRLAGEALEGPRQRRRGRLVARDEKRHQLVAELLVAHRRPVLVAGVEEHREDVVAALASRGDAPRSARRAGDRPRCACRRSRQRARRGSSASASAPRARAAASSGCRRMRAGG